MADKLIDSANKFRNLMDWEYEFVIGRKGIERAFVVDFNEDDFHHLIGLHKLKDNDYVRTTKRSKIFNSILSGKLSFDKIKSSQYFEQVDERIDAFEKITDVLEKEPQVFRYSIKMAGAFSRIDADYLICHYADRDVFLFVKKRSNQENYSCISMFFRDRVDYALGQARYTLLKLTKTSKTSGQNEEIYRNPNYSEKTDD